MSKRKREDEAPAAANDFRQQRRIVATFTQSSEQLAQAFKTARGFERQKLGRRKKNAVKGKDAKDEARIDAEVKALKTLDLAAAARHYLSKTLLKHKAIAAFPGLPTEVKHSRAVPNDPATLNVHGRLCKSNPVREIFPRLLNDIKREFGIEDAQDAPAKQRRLRKKDFEAQEAEISSEDADTTPKAKPNVKRSPEASQLEDEESDDEMAHFDDRLASSDEEEDADLDNRTEAYRRLRASSTRGSEGYDPDDGSDDEDLDVEDLERQLELEGVVRKSPGRAIKKYNQAAVLSMSDVSSSEEFEVKEVKKATAPKKSSFMPSLTMGGYISGSGSDIDDEIDVAPKKNRRGQRARQQIWEQKYGKRAKHLQNQKDSRSSGWDAKRGAVGDDPRGKSKGTGMNRMALGKNRTAFADKKVAAPAAKKKAHKDDSGPLHPSWVAAKKLKEKKAVPVAFQGKKISFD